MRRVDLAELAREAREEALGADVVAILREHRKPGCQATRLALATTIAQLRYALRTQQAELLSLRERLAGDTPRDHSG